MTGRDMITASLRLLGVLAQGESLQASEATDGLTTLNSLIDSWSNESLLSNTKVREVFPLVSGQQTYTMGTGGNFDTSRAQKIENALVQDVASSPSVEVPMKIINLDEFAAITAKSTQSAYPIYLYADGAYPLENINVWPIPSSANNLVLYSWKGLSQVSTLNTVLSLPPGYERALKFNLAIDLAPEYGRPVTQEIAQIAIESKAAIKRMNTKPQYLRVDDALRPRSARWNWMTGEPT